MDFGQFYSKMSGARREISSAIVGTYVLDNGSEMSESVERQAGVDKLELEIEVTPQMLEAGKYALFPNEVLPWYNEEQVLAKIYRAMATAGDHS
jgi:hypothetical protein